MDLRKSLLCRLLLAYLILIRLVPTQFDAEGTLCPLALNGYSESHCLLMLAQWLAGGDATRDHGAGAVQEKYGAGVPARVSLAVRAPAALLRAEGAHVVAAAHVFLCI